MYTPKDELKKKISGCEVFIVLSTKNYLNSLRDSDSDVVTQIGIARELNKPFFIFEDSRMSKEDMEETRKYFSKDNVIERVTLDVGSKNFPKLAAETIKHAASMLCPRNKQVNIVTCRPDDKD